jgi:fermentation-respiration switch protein FrsA (DUF1100 family)
MLNLNSAPALPIRAGVWLVVTLVLLLVWRLGGIVIPSEQVHITLPFLALTDFILVGRHRLKQPVSTYLPAAVVLLFGVWGFCFLLLQEQARQIAGVVDWREPIFKVLFIASIFVLYSWWVRVLTWLLERFPGAQATLQHPRGWWLRLLRQGVPITLFVPYIFTSFNAHRSKIANAFDPQQAVKLAFSPASFYATDGVALSGWFIPAPRARGTVVVCHGVGANKSSFLGVAPFLHRAGWNVFFFDFRGHGDSSGHTTSFGHYEARDVAGAVRYLEARGGRNIVLYGFSMGGSAVLHAAPALPQVRAVIVDSTFASFRPLAQTQVNFLPPGPQRFMMGSIDLWTRAELGIGLDDIEPHRYVASIAPRPLLIIHGLDDALIAPTHAEANSAAAREPKVLWLVPGANHCLCRLVDPPTYEKRVANWLQRAF